MATLEFVYSSFLFPTLQIFLYTLSIVAISYLYLRVRLLNSFSGEKIANLGQMCSGIHNPDRKPICQGSFAVLDESSIEDKTVLLVKWDFYIPNDEMRQNKEAEWPYNG